MPTVRSPSSFAARKMRMAISLRLAASSFWMFLVFVIKGRHGHEINAHDKLYIFTRAAAMPQEFFKCGEVTNLVGRRNFRQKVAGTASALTGCGGVDFNCCTSATTLLHSLGLRLVA